MGNGKWETENRIMENENGKWKMGNWEMGNWEMRNKKQEMGNGKWIIEK